MLSTITFFFATSIIVFVQSQTWIGNYTAGSTCNTTICCCSSGQIVVTNPTTNILAVTFGLTGQCSSFTTYNGTTPYPSGYTGYLTFAGRNLTLILSSNSQTISTINPTSSACNSNAIRNSAIKQFGNTMAIVALIFIGLTKVV
jgi:hypothetical protein